MYYMRYTYKWLLHVNAHPRFLAREFQAPWALNREITVDDQRGAGEHKRTYIHTCTYLMGMWPMATFLPLMWEKTSELSDGLFIEAPV